MKYTTQWESDPIAPPDAHKETWYIATKFIMMCLFGALIISPIYATLNNNNTQHIHTKEIN